MSLIKSISGIRGTIGGVQGDNLTPLDIVELVSAFVEVRSRKTAVAKKVVVGRDARISGEMINQLVCATCISLGVDVVDIGMATTPTTELATLAEQAMGGIIITASHNPIQWNALKLLNEQGEFIDKEEGEEVLTCSAKKHFAFAPIDQLGHIYKKDYTTYHIEKILSLPLVDVDAIRAKHLTIVVDAINSVGGVVVPKLLKALGAEQVFPMNCNPNGIFAHNPEPLPSHLEQLCQLVKEQKADVGFAVDPDVDRLAIVCENGNFFGEEYTLVSIADYVLQHEKGATVSNLSSTRALRDVSEQYSMQYYASPVGEVNVVKKMHEVGAVIGGEGNGGIIYPPCHYGRDALVGIALFLSQLVKTNKKASELRKTYPNYFMCKKKIELDNSYNIEDIFARLKKLYCYEKVTDVDGLRIDFADGWTHIRKSNTEPIIRIYSEAQSEQKAQKLAEMIINNIQIH